MNLKTLIISAGLLLSLAGARLQAGPVEHLIHISVDGLHPGAVTALGREGAPNFFRLRQEGAFTDNARTDPDVAYTLPNHASQFTGRHVFGDDGHEWVLNDDPGGLWTLHLFKTLRARESLYIASVFDIVHDAGFRTALYANSSDFKIFDRSWDGTNGARDPSGSDDGRDKIDSFFTDNDMITVANRFVSDMMRSRYTYAFLHLREPDSTGHREKWDLTPGSAYLQAVRAVDAVLGLIFTLAEAPGFARKTAIILTADHSGELGTTFHLLLPPSLVSSGIVPFYVWGPGVFAGIDLYQLNPVTRANPLKEIPSDSDAPQPIRNGDAANLALKLLGLPAVPGSQINAAQDLAVSNSN